MKNRRINYFLLGIFLCCNFLISQLSPVFAATLSAPTNVSASDGIFTNKVRVTWEASPDASSYIISRSTLPVSQGGIMTKLATATGTSHHDTFLSCGVSYYYWIKAQNENDSSKYSHDQGYCLESGSTSFAYAVDNESLTFNIGGDSDWFWQNTDYYYDGDAAESGEIDDLQESWIQTAVRGPGTLEFYWKVSSELDGDLLEFYIDDIRQDFISGNIDWTLQSYSIPTGTSNLKWRYAKDSDKRSSADSAWIDKISWNQDFIYMEPPPAPINVSATDGIYTDKVQITWNAAPDATSYVIFRSELPVSQGGIMTKLATLSATSYDDLSGVCGVTYYYWVKAKNSYGASRYSYDKGRCSSPLPAPTEVSATDGTYTDKIVVSWLPSEGATSYDVYRDNYPEGEKTKIATTEDTNYEDTSVDCPDAYYYFIKASNSIISSEYSAYDSGYLRCPTPPPSSILPRPTFLSATDGTYTDKIILSWLSSNGATSYDVYRSTSCCETKTKIATTSDTGYIDSDPILNNKRTYYYWIMAIGPYGVSEYSLYDTGYLWRDPETPTAVNASDGTYWDTIKVTWKASEGATFYEVYRGHTANGEKFLRATVFGTSYNDPNVRCRSCCDETDIFYYWVKAINPAGDSAYSSHDTGYAYRTLPDSDSVSATDGTVENCIHITWNAITGAKSYIVYRATSLSGKKTPFFTSTNATTYVDSTVVCLTYYYWVRAVDSQGYFCTSTFTGNVDDGYTKSCSE